MNTLNFRHKKMLKESNYSKNQQKLHKKVLIIMKNRHILPKLCSTGINRNHKLINNKICVKYYMN